VSGTVAAPGTKLDNVLYRVRAYGKKPLKSMIVEKIPAPSICSQLQLVLSRREPPLSPLRPLDRQMDKQISQQRIPRSAYQDGFFSDWPVFTAE
jgi:hypothetical protein